jgi:hypothetical protein
MKTHTISMFRDARIIDIAKEGSTMSGIAQQTGIPFATVRRAIQAYDGIGIIRSSKIGKTVTVRINKNHPIVESMINTARWVNTVIWDPNSFVVNICEKNKIDYAFVGTSKIQYTKNESRNMVQIAISKNDFVRAKKIIQDKFKEIGIKTTDDPRKTIGNAMSITYIKCFPADKIKFNIYETQISSGEIIRARVADDSTEKQTMKNSSKEDTMFIPYSTYQ